MSEPESVPTKFVPMEVPIDLPMIYTDTVQVVLTNYDAILVLGLNHPDASGQIHRVPTHKIYMSLHLVKALAHLLNTQLSKYEATTAPLPTAEAIMQRGPK